MNKQELIKHQIVCYNVVIEQSVKAIHDLKAKLAEAEKPELRHGDFGITIKERTSVNGGFVAITDNQRSRDLEPYFKDGLSDGSEYAKKNPNDYTIFGNIFDLMKDWGEKFGNTWKSENGEDKQNIMVGTTGREGIWLGTCGNSDTYSEEVAYEIWCKLGHAIIELKRKKQQD